MRIERIVIFNEVADRLRSNHVVDTVSATPILRLALDESPNCAEIALVAQEVCLFFALRPEADGI